MNDIKCMLATSQETFFSASKASLPQVQTVLCDFFQAQAYHMDSWLAALASFALILSGWLAKGIQKFPLDLSQAQADPLETAASPFSSQPALPNAQGKPLFIISTQPSLVSFINFIYKKTEWHTLGWVRRLYGDLAIQHFSYNRTCLEVLAGTCIPPDYCKNCDMNSAMASHMGPCFEGKAICRSVHCPTSYGPQYMP